MISFRVFVAAAGFVAVVGALVWVLLPIRLDAMYQGAEVHCGTAWSIDTSTADLADLFGQATAAIYGQPAAASHHAECVAAASSRRAIAIPAAIAGGVVLLGALVVRTPVRTRD